MHLDSIGRYEIRERLGGGGFGDVYRAHDPSIPRDVAIKCLRRPEDPELLRLFRNEAAAAGHIVHENIVTVYDFGEVDGIPYLVMELLDGEDLGDILARGERLSLHECVELMRQVAVGLHYAHEQEIVHRDIKPSNIRRQENGKAKLMDFGIARVSRAGSGQSTKTGAVVGTLRYMSPEQLAGERVDARSDVFSYGVVYYELITGKHPFDGQTQTAMLYNIVNQQPAPLSEAAPHAPAALGPLLERLLAKDRDQRYQSLEEFLIDSELVVQEVRQERAESLMEEGTRAFSAGDLAQAQRALREALKLDPRNIQARELRERIRSEERTRESAPQIRAILERARELIAAEKFDDAIAELSKAHAIDPTNGGISALASQAESRRSQSLRVADLCRNAESALEQGNLDTALRHATRAADLATGAQEPKELLRRIQAEIDRTEQRRSFDTRIHQARGLVSMGSYDEAEREIEQLRSEYPGRDELQNLLTRVQNERGRVHSRAEISSALAAAREHVSEQRYAEAIRVLEPLQERFPDATEISSLAEYARDSWREHERERELSGLLTAARSHANEQQFDSALQILSGASSIHANDRRVLNAIRELTRAKEASERYSAVQSAHRLAAILYGERRLAEALKTIDDVVATHGDEARKALGGLRDQIVDADAAQHREASIGRAARQAQSLIDQHELDRAKALVGLAIGESGEDPRLTELQARIAQQEQVAQQLGQIESLTRGDQLDEAEAALEAARAQNPSDTRFETLAVRLGEARATYAQRRAFEELRGQVEPLVAERKFDHAMALLDQAGELGSKGEGAILRRRVETARSLDGVWQRVQGPLDEGDGARAGALLDDASQLFPDDAAFQEGLGKLRQRVDDELQRRDRLVSEATQPFRAEAGPAPGQPAATGLPKWIVAVAAVLALAVLGGIALLFVGGGSEVALTVTTQPAGATVRIGETECVTPNCTVTLPAGDYAVEARRPGYQSRAATVKVDPSAGSSRTLEYTLEPIPHRLQINTNLERGTVTLDDAPPVQLEDGQYQLPQVPAGAHRLTVSDGGKGTLALQFEAAPGEPAKLQSIETDGGLTALALATLGGRGQAISSEASGSIRVANQSKPFTSSSPAVFEGIPAGSQAVIYPSGGEQRHALAQFGNFPLVSLSLNTMSDIGILVVETPGVSGAEVLLNGRTHTRRVGAGPLRIRLDAGRYRVEVRKTGYKRPSSKTITLEPAGETRAAFTLQPLSDKATLAIRDAAQGTRVKIDGRDAGEVTDGSLSIGNITPGEHTVALSLKGHKPRSERRKFTAGTTVSVSGVLETTMGTLRVNLTPAAATVTITREGASRSTTLRGGEQTLEEGRYQYRASAEGYEEVSDILEIAAGETIRLPIRLPKKTASGPRPDAELENAWNAARQANSVAAYEGFLAKHGGSSRAADARRAIGALVWDQLDKDDLAALESFRDEYDDPNLRGIAEREIDRLQRAQQQANSGADEALRKDRNAVYAALARYSSAFGNKDLDGVKAAWPQIPKASFDGLKRTFNQRNVQLTMSLQPLADPEISGNTAKLRCQISTSTIKNGRASSTPPRTANVVLGRQAAGWIIQKLEIQN